MTGQFRTPTGKELTGTWELINCVARTMGVTRRPDGTFEPEYEGETDVDWDSQEPICDKGRRLWVDEDGRNWNEANLIFIPDP